jgi:hypothetical protein
MAANRCFIVFHLCDNFRPDDYGYAPITDLKKPLVDYVYLKEEHAMRQATNLASKHPGTQVYLLEATHVIEAKMPETVSKKFKENGELIPVERHLADPEPIPRFSTRAAEAVERVAATVANPNMWDVPDAPQLDNGDDHARRATRPRR